MARPKSTTKAKTTRKPASAKAKTAAKKPATRGRKPAATKTKSIENPKTGAHIGGMSLLSEHLSVETRRPPNNPAVPDQTIVQLNNILNDCKSILDNYTQHLRALDRMRLNGVGIKKQGFITRAYEIALENAEFLPHYLTIARFGADIGYFLEFRALVDLCTQIREKLWNIVMQSADIAYTDALEFYDSVSSAAKRRVDAAETLHNELKTFFSRTRTAKEDEANGMAAPTEKQLKRDFDSLLHSKHDGKLVIENVKPKLSGGKHAVIDETFRDRAEFRESAEGEISE